MFEMNAICHEKLIKKKICETDMLPVVV